MATETPPPDAKSNGDIHQDVEDDDGPLRLSKILVVGLKRSGKSAMLQVIFNNHSPKQTLYLEPTTKIEKFRINSAIPLEFWDCPGNVPLSTLPLNDFSTVLFVIDIQDNFSLAIPRLIDVITAVYQVNQEINVEVFVHKSDVLADDYRIETYRHVQQRIIEDLSDTALDVESLQIQFHITTIYDHSIHESISQVVQKLIDPLPYLEELLNVFCANSQLSKAFLFEPNSRIYVATDASPVDVATHNLCCDYIQLLSQLIPLYSDSTNQNPPDSNRWSNGSVRLNPDTTLAYWQITRDLAIVVLLPSRTYISRRGLIEYNLVFFKQGVQEILEVDTAERTRPSDAHTSP